MTTQPQPAAPEVPPGPTWGVAGWALVVIAFVVGFYNFPLRVVGTGFTHLPGDPADNRLNNYVLEHGYRYVTGREASFWDAPMFYPAPGTTRTSDAHLGMLPFYSALRICGLSPEDAFQGYFVIPFLLNYAAAVWGIRRLGFGPVAATIGAYVFAFPLPLAGQLAHVQLFPRFMVPPAVVFGWEFLREPKSWRAWAVVASVVGQTYLAIYIGYFLCLLLAAGLIVGTVLCLRSLPWRELVRPGRKTWASRIAAVGVGALVLTPLLANHARAGGGASVEAIRDLAPKPAAWITPPMHAAAFPELADKTQLGTLQAGEQQVLPGLLALAALPLGLVCVGWRGPLTGTRATVAVAACSALALGFFITRFEDRWFYEPVAHLPGAGGIRAISRAVLVLEFPLGLVLGACAGGLVWAVGQLSRALAAVVALVAVGTVAADHWLVPTPPPLPPKGDLWWPMRNPKEVVVRRQSGISEAIRQHPAPKLLFVFPSYGAGSVGGSYGVQPEAMRAAQDAGIPCVNGWSGYTPAGWDFFPSYRALFAWLEAQGAAPELVEGLVVVGDPVPDPDPQYEARMREKYPPWVLHAPPAPPSTP